MNEELFVGDNDHGDDKNHLYWKSQYELIKNDKNPIVEDVMMRNQELTMEIIRLTKVSIDQGNELNLYKFKNDVYTKDAHRLNYDMWAAQREICEMMCDFERNKQPVFMLPQEYADLRGWHCYSPQANKLFGVENI